MYNYIWNLNDKQYKRDVTDNDNLLESEKEYLEAIRNMNEEWTTEKNLKNAEKYGAAVGTYNAAQSVVGMQLYKLNPFKLNLLNQGMRVMIDTGSGASNVPARASFLAAIDEDTDFNTAYEELGGTEAVLVDAGMSFGFSVVGEIIQENNSKKLADEMYEQAGVSKEDFYTEVDRYLRNDIKAGKISIEDVDETVEKTIRQIKKL